MRIDVQADHEAASQSAVALTLSKGQEAIAARGRFLLALSGGSTPQRYHQLLAQAPQDALDWSLVKVLFCDERAVGPEHEHSNYRMAKQTLLDHSAIKAENVHRIEADDGDAARAAAQYAGLLQALGGVLDLAILGMGGDGHTCSLFPGATQPEGLVVAVKAPPSSPIEDRVTLSYQALKQARCAAVMVTGEKKAERLRQALEEQGDLPIQKVCADRGQDILFFIDRGAASLLTNEPGE